MSRLSRSPMVLVIPLPVIVRGVLASCLPQRLLAEEDHPIQAFIFDRPDESLGVGIQVGRTVRQAYDLDAGSFSSSLNANENLERVENESFSATHQAGVIDPSASSTASSDWA